MRIRWSFLLARRHQETKPRPRALGFELPLALREEATFLPLCFHLISSYGQTRSSDIRVLVCSAGVRGLLVFFSYSILDFFFSFYKVTKKTGTGRAIWGLVWANQVYYRSVSIYHHSFIWMCFPLAPSI